MVAKPVERGDGSYAGAAPGRFQRDQRKKKIIRRPAPRRVHRPARRGADHPYHALLTQGLTFCSTYATSASLQHHLHHRKATIREAHI